MVTVGHAKTDAPLTTLLRFRTPWVNALEKHGSRCQISSLTNLISLSDQLRRCGSH